MSHDFSVILQRLLAKSTTEREAAYKDLRDYFNLTTAKENLFWSTYLEELMKLLTLDITNAEGPCAQYSLEILARLLSGVVFNTLSNDELEKIFCNSNAINYAIESVIDTINKKDRILSSFALFLISEERVPFVFEKYFSELIIAISSCLSCCTFPEVRIYSMKGLLQLYEQMPFKLLQQSSLWASHVLNCLIADDIRIQNCAISFLKRITDDKSYPLSSFAAEVMHPVMETLT